MNDDFNFNFTDLSKHTPNRNISMSKIGTPINYSNEPFPNSFLNESNGVKLTNITNEITLRTKFDSQEESIRSVCLYYISLKNIFNEADIDIKNKLLQYVTEFNNSCKNFLEKKTNNFIAAKRNSEEKNKLKENLNQKTEEFNNLEKKFRIEKKELEESTRKEIQELKFKLKDAEDKNKKFKAKLEECDNKLKEKEKQMYSLREEFKSMDQPLAQDFINISYCLGEQTENMDIKINCPTKKELEQFIPNFKKAESNFNYYSKMLVETSNNALGQLKNIYKKLKGKEWIMTNNSLIKMHNIETYNINQDLSWTNISKVHETINAIINEIVELVNPTKSCDAKKLNEDSCEFLLDYIVGLKKLFFLQKEVIDRDLELNQIKKIEGSTNGKKNFSNLKKYTGDIESFFRENKDVMMNNNYYEKYENELNVENTKNMMVDDYMKTLKGIFSQAKNIAEKGENDFDKFKKDLDRKSKRTRFEEVEMYSNNKNRNIDNLDLDVN